MKDPYETLGVNRSATDKEIKDAFKKLARKFHPDLHPGDQEAEGKFKAYRRPKTSSTTRRSDGDSMRVRSMPAELSGRRSGSIVTSPTARPMPRTQRRMALPTTRNWRNFCRVRLRAVDVGRRARFARVARM
jgi:curved DNA-binding protein CbpA